MLAKVKAKEFIPHDYQRHCIDKLIENPRYGLYIDMGLGKTIITLSAIKHLRDYMFLARKVLIIAPKKVAENTWQSEAKKWKHTEHYTFSAIMGSEKKRIEAIYAKADIYVINRDNVTWLIDFLKHEWDFDTVIIDESTSFKNPKAKRFKSLTHILPRVDRLIELSGTPSPNGIQDLWAQVFLLDEGERLGKSFYGFRQRFYSKDPYKPHTWELKSGGYSSCTNLISDICLSLKSDDYIKLPDLISQHIEVSLTPKALREYEELERKMILDLPDLEDISATNAAALSTKLLQLASGAVYDDEGRWSAINTCKIDALTEMIESLQGEHLIIYYQYRHEKERILQVLKKFKLRVSCLENKEDEEKWNRGEIDVIVGHPQSMAYGLNLQGGGNHIIWFSLPWSYEFYTQANKRLHRQGQGKPVIVHSLITKGTRDEDVLTAIKNKKTTQDAVIESLKARIRRVKDAK